MCICVAPVYCIGVVIVCKGIQLEMTRKVCYRQIQRAPAGILTSGVLGEAAEEAALSLDFLLF